MRRAFLSDSWERELCEEGYVSFPFLSEEELNALRAIHASLTPATNDVFHTSHWNRDFSYREKVHAHLLPLLKEKAESILSDYVAAYAYFLVKGCGPGSEVRPHQDWTVVDETRFRSLIFWMPLSHTNEENGCFHVVPRSHKVLRNLRGTGIEPGYSQLIDEIEREAMQPLPLKAGHALVFDMRLLHGSPQNRSHAVRVAAGLALKPREANFIHWAKDPRSGVIHKWSGGEDFLLKFAFGDAPDQLLQATAETAGENFAWVRAKDLCGAKD